MKRPPPARQIVVVDNASTDGSADLVQERYPEVTILRLGSNTGFTGGNNAGVDLIRKTWPHVRYVAPAQPGHHRHPPVGCASWSPLPRVRRTSPRCRPKLLFHPETKLLNSAGNKSHYLGFGFVSAYREEDRGQYDSIRELAFCSGAAMLVRLSAVAGDLFDPAYFAYLEDAELGWRLRLAGGRNLFCPASVVYHRYQFSRNREMYYRLESNRWRMLLSCYIVEDHRPAPAGLPDDGSRPAVLLPARWGDGAKNCARGRYWARFGPILRRRREVQKQRKISDRELTSLFIATADFAEVRNPLLTYIGNPLLQAYWALARSLLWW